MLAVMLVTGTCVRCMKTNYHYVEHQLLLVLEKCLREELLSQEILIEQSIWLLQHQVSIESQKVSKVVSASQRKMLSKSERCEAELTAQLRNLSQLPKDQLPISSGMNRRVGIEACNLNSQKMYSSPNRQLHVSTCSCLPLHRGDRLSECLGRRKGAQPLETQVDAQRSLSIHALES